MYKAALNSFWPVHCNIEKNEDIFAIFFLQHFKIMIYSSQFVDKRRKRDGKPSDLAYIHHQVSRKGMPNASHHDQWSHSHLDKKK